MAVFRIGCCGCMADGGVDGTGIHVVETAAALGFDYVELSLAHLAKLDTAAFAELKRRLAAADIPCETCHNFFPADIRLTGETADLQRAVAYADSAMARAAAVGAQVIVFGSSGAKNVPEGFPVERAWAQVVALLRAIDPLARRHGVVIAIEPINRDEANFINLVAEGQRLAEDVGGDNIRLLADYYHVMKENEPLADIVAAGPYLRHVHFAEVENRSYPAAPREEYARFFRALAQGGYRGRVSVEAFTKDFAGDARQALAVLRPILDEAGR